MTPQEFTMINSTVLSVSAYVVATACVGVIGYLFGEASATTVFNRKLEQMRKDYMSAVEAIYKRYMINDQRPVPPPPTKPKPRFHVFKNDSKREETPSK